MSREDRIQRADECRKICCARRAHDDRRRDSDERAVAAVKRQRVVNEHQPVPVLTRDRAAVTLIPVVDEILFPVLPRDVAVDLDVTPWSNADSLAPPVDPFPPGAGSGA